MSAVGGVRPPGLRPRGVQVVWGLSWVTGLVPAAVSESSPDRVTLHSLMTKPIQRFPQFIPSCSR